MKSTFVWLIFAGTLLLFGDAVVAWNRQLFNRYSRNFPRNIDMLNAAGMGGGGGGNGGGVGAGGGVGSETGAGAGGNREMDDFQALFGLGNDERFRSAAWSGGGAGSGAAIGGGVAGGGGSGLGNAVDFLGGQQQQTEVYGIVEPLIEDMPCVDRPCQVNDDCCPTGVCVNTYGEGKCIYVYGRKRDLCHRNADCEPGMLCLKGAAGNLVCQPTPPGMRKALELKQFGEDCVSSSDCNVAKGMCCQLQRTHHRVLPKKMCAFFRDPFTCIDIMPSEDEETRESRFLSSFSQRRM